MNVIRIERLFIPTSGFITRNGCRKWNQLNIKHCARNRKYVFKRFEKDNGKSCLLRIVYIQFDVGNKKPFRAIKSKLTLKSIYTYYKGSFPMYLLHFKRCRLVVLKLPENFYPPNTPKTLKTITHVSLLLLQFASILLKR